MIPYSKRAAALLGFFLWCIAGCAGPQPVADRTLPASSDRTITVTLLQLNDVYEITPVQGGKAGGLARVAALRRRLLADNPNTLTLLAGDFFSPSAIGTARVDGERLAGKQMVAVLNAVGLDYATFGNHEFDVDEDQFGQRLSESEFTYISSNVFDANQRAFPGVQSHELIKIPGRPGDTLRVGIVGVTVGSNPKDYVRYTDPVEAVRAQVALLRGRTDALVAITHLALAEDMVLAEQVPELDLITGGHEHENWYLRRGPDLTPIAKADANARTVYVHDLRFDPATRALSVASRLVEITDALPDDAATARVVDRWVGLAFEGFRQQGLKPAEPVATLTEPLDGLETSVRNRATILTRVVADAMLHAAPDAVMSVYNGGSLRIDDVLQPGTLIEYDVIRILPFGGEILSVDMPGSLLDSVLTQGQANQGSGGFLQHANAEQRDGRWSVGGRPIDPAQTYRVAINDFLLTGREANLGYLTVDHPGVTEAGRHGDIRLAVIAELKRRYGGP